MCSTKRDKHTFCANLKKFIFCSVEVRIILHYNSAPIFTTSKMMCTQRNKLLYIRPSLVTYMYILTIYFSFCFLFEEEDE